MIKYYKNIILIFLLFFFVGFLKQVYAAYPGDCTKVRYNIIDTLVALPIPNMQYAFDTWTINSDGHVLTSNHTIRESGNVYLVRITVAYYENGAWSYAHSTTTGVAALGPGESVSVEVLNALPTGICPDCEDEFNAKIEECGGEQYIESWNNEECIGLCYCENDGDDYTHTFMQLQGFCGGLGKVESYDIETCIGKCKDDCSQEYNWLENICGLAGIDQSTWDEDTCTGECNQDCTEEYNSLEHACGIHGIKASSWDQQTCTGECNEDCSTEYNDLEYKCGLLGIAKWDNETCSGECNNCYNRTKSCQRKCKGSVKDYACNDSQDKDGNYYSLNEGQCECGDPKEGLAGEDGGIGEPGQYGGDVVINPDGSKTETMPDGTTYQYGSDGGWVLKTSPNGDTTEYGVTQDGVTYTIQTDSETGETTEIEKYEKDGMIITTTTETDGTGEVVSVETVENVVVPPDPVDNPETPENEAEENKPAYYSGYKSNVDKRINWEPITSVVTKMEGKFPISIMSKMIDLVQLLQATPEAPSFTVPFIYGQLVIDLSVVNPLATIFRYMIGILLVVATIFGIIKTWSN